MSKSCHFLLAWMKLSSFSADGIRFTMKNEIACWHCVVMILVWIYLPAEISVLELVVECFIEWRSFKEEKHWMSSLHKNKISKNWLKFKKGKH